MRLRERLAVLIESAGRLDRRLPAASASERSMRRARLKITLGVIVLVAVVFLFVIRAKATAEDLIAHWQSLNLANIGWSFVIVLAAFGLAAGLWWSLIRILGGSLSRREALRIYFLSSLPRYIPGSVWGYVGRSYLIEQQGVRRTVAIVSTLIEVELFVGSGFTVGLWHWLEPYAAGVISVVITLAMIVGLVYVPRLLNSDHRWSLRAFVLAATTVAGYLAFWMMYGLSIIVLVQGFVTVIRPNEYIGIISGFAISWLAGFLAIFVPGGLGVREAGVTLTIELAVGGVAAIFIAILSRVINLTADALLFFVAILTKRPMSTFGFRNDNTGT